MNEQDNLEVGTDETLEQEQVTEDATEQDNSQETLESSADSEDSNDEAGDEGAESEEDERIKRYKQQMKGSQEEAKRLRQMVLDNEIAKAGDDAEAVLKLHKKDPKMAKEVAEHYGFDSIEAVELFIKKQQSGDTNLYSEEEVVKRAEKIAEKKLKEKEHQKAVAKIGRKIAKLPKEYQEDAQSYVNDLIDGRFIDEDKATTYAEMVTLYVQKKKANKDARVDGLAEFSSTGLGSGGKKKSSPSQDFVIIDGKLVLDSDN